MNIATCDLNLLRVFAALYEKKNASSAGKVLGLSQPAVSHALARLRTEFEDELFVRTPRGLLPTPRTVELGPFIQKMLRELEDKLTKKVFVPSEATGTFQLRGTDYFEQAFLPSLMSLLRTESPGLKVASRSTQGVLPRAELEDGSCDVAVAGFFGELPPGLYQQRLFQDKLVGIARSNHPYFKNPGIKEYLKHPHIVVSGEGKMEGQVDRALAAEKKKRNVVMAVSGSMPAGWIVKDSDLLIAMPGKLAYQLRDCLGLRTFDVPVKLKPIEIVQVWHEVVHQDPRHQWLRKKLFEACQSA